MNKVASEKPGTAGKNIGFKLKGELAQRVRALKKEVGLPASSIGEIALEYFIPAIQRGEFAIINGKLVRSASFLQKEAA